MTSISYFLRGVIIDDTKIMTSNAVNPNSDEDINDTEMADNSSDVSDGLLQQLLTMTSKLQQSVEKVDARINEMQLHQKNI